MTTTPTRAAMLRLRCGVLGAAVVLLLLRHHLLDIANTCCRSRPTLRRRCRRRAPAWRSAACSALNAASAPSSSQASARRLALAQQVERRSISSSCPCASLSPLFARFSSGVIAPLEALEVGQHQLGLDRLGVGDRIDRALDVGDVAVLEAAQHMHDGVDLADVGRGTGCRGLRPC